MQGVKKEASTSTTAVVPVSLPRVVPIPEGMQAVYQRVRCLAATSAVVVFIFSGCCMGLVVTNLLLALGVAPAFIEIETGGEIHALLDKIAGKTEEDGQQVAVPAVFIGGKYLGGVDKVVACHISGGLVPRLKDAGALWL